MPLSDAQIERYARQIVLPDVGIEGQQRLLSATVLLVGDELGCRLAGLYLRAAGVRTAATVSSSGIDCALLANNVAVEGAAVRRIRDGKLPVAWYALREGTLESGVAEPGDRDWPLPPPLRRGNRTSSQPRGMHFALQQAGACEAAGLCLVRLLGWPQELSRDEVDFA
ncbi:MAG: hypothetical protein ACE5E4_00255 [Candidatus Binatia bacterium]